jgi:hypothetical protein
MAAGKSEVVSVRVEPPIKIALQSAADREMRSLANMVEVMVIAYCRSNSYPLPGVPAEALPNATAARPRSAESRLARRAPSEAGPSGGKAC